MGKQIVCSKNVLMGTLCGILMLGGCAYQSEESRDDTEWLILEEEDSAIVSDVASDEKTVPDLTVTETVCADGSCVQTENYLTNKFVQEKTLDLSSDTAPLAISRPVGQGTTSVREKMAEKNAAEETVWFTAVAVPEKADAATDEAEPTTDESGKEGEQSAQSQEDVVEETVVTVDQQPVTVETTTETAVQVETNPAQTEQQVVPVVPAGVVPLKKVTTTITETTTKYQKERKTADSAEPQTLAEKVAYGEEVHDWMAESGSTLRKLLLAWGNKSGWTVIWKLDRDYRLEAGVIFRGTFTEVSAALIRSFARATPPPIGSFYQGNRVLVISTQEDDNER